ncbi:MAG: tyrosine-protein phosphatase [Nitrospirota bacterium]
MRLPGPTWPWQAIHKSGFSDLVSLHPYSLDPAPLTVIFRAQLEDLVHGGPPGCPDRELRLIREAVRATIQSLHKKRGVVVHCHGGRGRTGTVLGCVLRELDYDGEDVVSYLNEIHIARGKSGWPESTWQGDVVRRWPEV